MRRSDPFRSDIDTGRIIIFLYSTGTYNGKVKFGDAGYYLKKQLFASVLGMIAFG